MPSQSNDVVGPIPVADLVRARYFDIVVDQAVGTDELYHLGILLLDIAKELFVTHWQWGKQFFDAHCRTLLVRKS